MSDSKYYISIDVATKSLAIGLYRIRCNFNLTQISISNPIDYNHHLNNLVVPLLMKVYDLVSGSNVRSICISDKAITLKTILTQLDFIIGSFNDKERTTVLIEYQMNANHLSNAIFNMLIYHYANHYPIRIIKPSLKNSICLHPKLSLSNMLSVCSSNYKANKDHCKYNMLYFLTITDRLDLLTDIKKKNYDDIADTLLQALAYHYRQI